MKVNQSVQYADHSIEMWTDIFPPSEYKCTKLR